MRPKDLADLESEDLVTPVGPGAVAEEGIAPKPSLEGATEFEVIEILNPLSVDFIGQFGLTKPIRAEVTISPTIDGTKMNESQATQQYGIPRLTNPAKSGNANIINRVRIPSGKTVRVLGSEAQVLVRQLVNEIMQRQGQRLQLADAFQRRKVEDSIIISRGNINDILGKNPVSVSEQLREAIKPTDLETPVETHNEPVSEPEFPTLNQPVETPKPIEPIIKPEPVEPKPRRKRRTREQMAKVRAAKAARAAAHASS